MTPLEASQRNGVHLPPNDLPGPGWAVAAHGLQDPLSVLNTEFVENDLAFRLSLMQGLSMDPRRNLNDECGFPHDGEFVPTEKYQRLYERDALFARVIECIPRECWATQPLVYSSDDPTKATPFEQAWDELGKNLRGGNSRYRDEEGSPVWSYLIRADILSGIGRYGVILLGLDDGRPLHEPVEGVEEQFSMEVGRSRRLNDPGGPDGKPLYDELLRPAPDGRITGVYNLTVNQDKAKGRKLVYLRVFPEILAPVIRWENNSSSPRFGQPTAYQITFNDPFGTQQTHGGAGLDSAVREVHWTRVLHVADTYHAVSSNDFMAVPRGQQVLNDVLSAQKPRWAGPEGYFKSCIPTTVISTHPALGGNVKSNPTQLRDMVERVQNGMQKWMYLMGAGASALAPQVVDSTPFIEWSIKIICIKLNIPIRIFMGSERGELASTEDEGDWSEERKARNRNYTIPNLVVPFIDRLILVGVLPDPGEPHDVAQEEESVLSPEAEESGAADEENEPPFGKAKEERANEEEKVPKVPVGNAIPPQFARGRTTKDAPATSPNQPGGKRPTKSKDGKSPPPGAVKPGSGGLVPMGDPNQVKFRTEGGYVVEWPDTDTQSEAEKANVALTSAQADAAYVAGDNGQLLAPMDYLTRSRGFSEEEAAAIIENAAARKEELKAEQQAQMEEQMAQQQQAIDKGIVPDPNDPDLVPDTIIGGGGPPQPPGKGGPPRPGQPPGKKKPGFPPKPSLNVVYNADGSTELVDTTYLDDADDEPILLEVVK